MSDPEGYRFLPHAPECKCGCRPVTAPSPRPAAPEVTHACPEGTSGVTGCCGRTPFELPRTDRLATNPAWVTCRPAAPDTTGELRSAIFAAMPVTVWQAFHGPCETPTRDYREAATDAVLAGPLRDLLAERDTLAAKVRAVEGLHVPSHAYCVVCDRDRDVEALGNAFPCDHHTSFCRACDYSYPCPTRRALGTPTTGTDR